MSIKNKFPNIRPSLNLDFAKTKRLDPRITFSRSSSATYVDANGVIQTAAANVPRFDHDPATGESLGLLIEEARTNSITYSEQFDNAAWTKNNLTVTANSVTAPDGSLTADTIAGTGGSSLQRVLYNNSDAGAGIRTASVYAKAGTNNFIQLYCGSDGSVYANFNLASGTVGSTGSSSTASIQALPNGWYRCILYISSATADTTFIGLISSATAARGEQNTLSTTVYLWGAQSEKGFTFPTSYIPTTTATVTRSADVAQMTGTNFSSWYRQDEGSFFVSTTNNPATSSFLLDCGNTSTIAPGASGHDLRISSTTSGAYTQVSNVGVASFDINYSGTSVKTAYGYKLNNFNCAVNGALGTLDTSGSLPTLGAQQIFIGSRFNSTYIVNKPIARLAYYPARLTDAQLQNLTY